MIAACMQPDSGMGANIGMDCFKERFYEWQSTSVLNPVKSSWKANSYLTIIDAVIDVKPSARPRAASWISKSRQSLYFSEPRLKSVQVHVGHEIYDSRIPAST